MSNRNRFLVLSNHASKSKKEKWRSDNFRDSNQEKKQRTDTVNEAKKSNDFTRGNREMSNIAIAILEN